MIAGILLDQVGLYRTNHHFLLDYLGETFVSLKVCFPSSLLVFLLIITVYWL